MYANLLQECRATVERHKAVLASVQAERDEAAKLVSTLRLRLEMDGNAPVNTMMQ